MVVCDRMKAFKFYMVTCGTVKKTFSIHENSMQKFSSRLSSLDYYAQMHKHISLNYVSIDDAGLVWG